MLTQLTNEIFVNVSVCEFKKKKNLNSPYESDVVSESCCVITQLTNDSTDYSEFSATRLTSSQ